MQSSAPLAHDSESVSTTNSETIEAIFQNFFSQDVTIHHFQDFIKNIFDDPQLLKATHEQNIEIKLYDALAGFITTKLGIKWDTTSENILWNGFANSLDFLKALSMYENLYEKGMSDTYDADFKIEKSTYNIEKIIKQNPVFRHLFYLFWKMNNVELSKIIIKRKEKYIYDINTREHTTHTISSLFAVINTSFENKLTIPQKKVIPLKIKTAKEYLKESYGLTLSEVDEKIFYKGLSYHIPNTIIFYQLIKKIEAIKTDDLTQYENNLKRFWSELTPESKKEFVANLALSGNPDKLLTIILDSPSIQDFLKKNMDFNLMELLLADWQVEPSVNRSDSSSNISNQTSPEEAVNAFLLNLRVSLISGLQFPSKKGENCKKGRTLETANKYNQVTYKQIYKILETKAILVKNPWILEMIKSLSYPIMYFAIINRKLLEGREPLLTIKQAQKLPKDFCEYFLTYQAQVNHWKNPKHKYDFINFAFYDYKEINTHGTKVPLSLYGILQIDTIKEININTDQELTFFKTFIKSTWEVNDKRLMINISNAFTLMNKLGMNRCENLWNRGKEDGMSSFRMICDYDPKLIDEKLSDDAILLQLSSQIPNTHYALYQEYIPSLKEPELSNQLDEEQTATDLPPQKDEPTLLTHVDGNQNINDEASHEVIEYDPNDECWHMTTTSPSLSNASLNNNDNEKESESAPKSPPPSLYMKEAANSPHWILTQTFFPPPSVTVREKRHFSNLSSNHEENSSPKKTKSENSTEWSSEIAPSNLSPKAFEEIFFGDEISEDNKSENIQSSCKK